MVLLLALSLVGCQKPRQLNYSTAENLNAMNTEPGQPVMLGLYQLSGRPDGIADQNCKSLKDHEATLSLLENWLVPSAEQLSVTPNTARAHTMKRLEDARWLLVVPYYQQCDPNEVSSWALIRLRRGKRELYIDLNSYQLSLPWERRLPRGRARRQRGNIDGEPHHVIWKVY